MPPRPDARCTVDGCSRPLLARGWCSTHYSRWRTHGDPVVAVPIVPRVKLAALAASSRGDR